MCCTWAFANTYCIYKHMVSWRGSLVLNSGLYSSSTAQRSRNTGMQSVSSLILSQFKRIMLDWRSSSFECFVNLFSNSRFTKLVNNWNKLLGTIDVKSSQTIVVFSCKRGASVSLTEAKCSCLGDTYAKQDNAQIVDTIVACVSWPFSSGHFLK